MRYHGSNGEQGSQRASPARFVSPAWRP